MDQSGNLSLTGHERTFSNDEIIVSKTDLKGRITYANRTFMHLADYEEQELLGAPHSLIRHPDMPRCVFKLLWDTLEAKKEIFAYVVNRSKNGDHYWVFAHVTPSFDGSGNINGYHSNRRVPNRKVLNDTIIPLYKTLLDVENQSANRKDGMNRGYAVLEQLLQEKGVGYDELIFSL
ncbi:MAG: PAS domain-containing protein [Rhodospirillales bacterium]|nr:PAS domain-containing protein [Rhodospirillales bacterium]MCB9995861.1 PAS domain-containing protein [Rhodospirillales bacterium]